MKNDDDDDDDDDDEVSRPKYAYFYLAQLKTIHTAPWQSRVSRKTNIWETK